MDEFQLDGLDEFTRDLMKVANDLKEKETKKFLRQEGSKLNKTNKKVFKSKGIKKQSGNLEKGFKRGKVYKYDGAWSIRGYNSSPHAHLLDQGHRIVTKTGEEKGFKEGYHFMDEAEKEFRPEFIEDVEDFIDDLLKNHNL